MTLIELKKCITNKVAPTDFMIFVTKDNPFLASQYIKAIGNLFDNGIRKISSIYEPQQSSLALLAVPEGTLNIITVETFANGDKVDVVGYTKGHGFSGVIKRWNQHKLMATHGVGPVHREVGSMGANSSPSRVFKNKHMPGQYGNERVTVQNLEIVKVDTNRNVLLVKGAIPGAKGGIVTIQKSVKA